MKTVTYDTSVVTVFEVKALSFTSTKLLRQCYESANEKEYLFNLISRFISIASCKSFLSFFFSLKSRAIVSLM